MSSATLLTSSPAIALDPETVSRGGRLVTRDGRDLPLRGTEVVAFARGGVARTVLQQRFVNSYPEALHVTYALPLPADGAVSGFRFALAGRVIVGEVETRARARERFDAALARGSAAALLEQERANQFRQEVGNIPPGAELMCEVEVDQKLVWLAEGAWEWRFPAVVGPRYMGASGRVADAAALNVPMSEAGTGVAMQLRLVVGDATVAGHAPGSPSHRLRCERVGSETHVAFDPGAFEKGGVALDRDVVVRWQVAAQEVGVGIEVARPAGHRHDASRAFGLVTLVPPAAAAGAATLPRDLIFLIDTSGSMDGAPLTHARRIAAALIDGLGDHDTVELIEFSDAPNRFRPEAIAASRDGKRAALAWLAALQAGGGTEMTAALLEALTPLRPGSQRQVVLITDGYIGFENEILRTLHRALPAGSRLHTVGVGSAPNRALTGPAARAAGGLEVLIGLDEDVEPAVARLLARTQQPVLTQVHLEGEGVEVRPARLPDVFAGAPLLVSVALPATGGRLRLRAESAAGAWTREVDVRPVTLGTGNPGVAALFGREHLEDLEAQRATCDQGRDHEAVDHEIEQVALRFSLASRCTSWVAVDERVLLEPGAKRREETMPHEIPYGLSIAGLGLRGGAAAPPAPLAGAPSRSRAVTGAFAAPAAPMREVLRQAAPPANGKTLMDNFDAGEADESSQIHDLAGIGELQVDYPVPPEEAPLAEPMAPEVEPAARPVAPRISARPRRRAPRRLRRWLAWAGISVLLGVLLVLGWCH